MNGHPPRFLDQVRDALRVRHYSLRSEKAYVGWIRRFILYHQKRHPDSMGVDEVNAFLTHLAVDDHVSVSTQNQALAALLFLYQTMIKRPLPDLDGVIRASKPKRLPVVMTREEVRAVLRNWMVSRGSWERCSMERECVSWNVCGYESRTSTSNGPAF